MKRIIITNNQKVSKEFEGKAEIRMIEGATSYRVFEEAEKLAQMGGRLLLDPSRGGIGSYYKSLIFMIDEDGKPDAKSIALIDQCLGNMKRPEGMVKEPILAGIQQKKEIDILKKVIG